MDALATRPRAAGAGGRLNVRLAARAALGALAAAAASGCPGRVLDLEVQLVTRACETDAARAPALDPLANVSQLRFTVYGEGIDSFNLQVREVVAAKTAVLPGIAAGRDRRLVVEALATPNDVVVARGDSGPLDLTVQGPVHLAIFLRRTDVFSPACNADGAASRLVTARAGHTATLLADGRVLLAGGFYLDGAGARVYTRSLEVYDPHTGLFTSLPAEPPGRKELAVRRAFHTATALPGTTQVVIAGGEYQDGARTVAVRAAEIFDSSAQRLWDEAAPMRAARTQHAAAVPPAPGRLLLAGGFDDQGRALQSTETWDPAKGAFEDGPNLAAPRAQLGALGLPGGLVFLAGGWSGTAALRSTELFAARSTGLYEPVAAGQLNLDTPRLRPLLAGFGEKGLLVTGGFSDRDPAEGYTFSAAATDYVDLSGTPAHQSTSATLLRKRGNGGAAALPDGTVLVGGGGQLGQGDQVVLLPSADMLHADPHQAGGVAIRRTTGELAQGRALAAWTVLADGTVLVTGGLSLGTDGKAQVLQTAELFQPRYRATSASPWK